MSHITTGQTVTAAELNALHSLISARWTRTTNQAIGSGTDTILAGANETHRYDPDSVFSMSGGTVTVNQTGIYVVTSGGTWANNSTGGRRWAILQNSTIVARQIQASTSSPLSQMVSTGPLSFTATDTFAVQVTQFSGGLLNIDVAETPAFLSVMRVGEL